MVQHEGSNARSGLPSEDIRRLCGDIPDWKVISIAALRPSAAELETAVAWADRQDEFQRQSSLSGVASEVYDILTSDEDASEER